MLEYYGSDWAAMVLSVASIWMLGSRQRSGFIVMVIGNTAWTVYGLLVMNLPVIISNVIFAALNLRGYYKWSHSPQKQ